MRKLTLILFVLPIFSFSQTVSYRQYKAGETVKYQLTSEAYRNGKLAGKTISISQHTVVADSGFLSEEIRWVNKVSVDSGDSTLLDTLARQVAPYKISLSPRGKVLLPKLTIAEMVGDITDLNTFFVAIAPALNAQKLSLKDSVFKNDKSRQGNFADGNRILKGTDCMEITQHLLSTNDHYSTIKTDFAPPKSFCLEPLADIVAKKSGDIPNNFQMIQKGTGDKVNLFWGMESFTITTKIDNKTGRIVEAAMVNLLTLTMRYNTTQDLKTYAMEMPISITRNIKLELIQE
jgi:hypothetical protein